MKKVFAFPLIILLFFLDSCSVSFAFHNGNSPAISIVSPSENAIISSGIFQVYGKFNSVQPTGYTVQINVTVNSIKKEYLYTLSNPSDKWGPVVVHIKDFGLNLLNGKLFDCTIVAVLEDSTGIPVMGATSKIRHFKWGIASAPFTPQLLSPKDHFVFASISGIQFKWSKVEGSEGYNFELSTDVDFKDIILSKELSSNTYKSSGSLLSFGRMYYWRVNSFNKYGTSTWSKVFDFTIKDTNPPIINLTSPTGNLSTMESKVYIIGTVKDNESGVKSVKVNGNSLALNSDGSFSVTVSLTKGKNTITIVATDKAGNKATKTIIVTYKPQIVITLQPDNPYMTVNSISQEIDPGRGTKPVIVSKWNRTVVPIRAIVEALGGTIEWDGTERKVTIHFNGTTIELWIDNPKAKVNGEMKWIDPKNHDVKPIIVNGRTMLPLRFVAENLGCIVQWDASTKMITIIYGG